MMFQRKKSVYAFAVAAALVVLAACQDVKNNENVVPAEGVAQTVADSSAVVIDSSRAKLAATCYTQLSAAELPTLSFPLRDWATDASKFPFVSLLNYGADWTWATCTKNYKAHSGIDYGNPLVKGVRKDLKDAPVYAVYDGTVKAVYDAGNGWGSGITIEHSYTYKNAQKKNVTITFTSNYTHVNEKAIYVKVGDSVKKGKLLSIVKDLAGKSTNHLHFSLRYGAYTNISNRGALPNANDAVKTTCKCSDEPVFPENFLNPNSVKFENKQL